MRKKIKHKWEELDLSENHATYRLRVYAGWKVTTVVGKQVTSIFVPDMEHDWIPILPEKVNQEP